MRQFCSAQSSKLPVVSEGRSCCAARWEAWDKAVVLISLLKFALKEPGGS